MTPQMKTTFLDFEQPIAELEQRIEELRYVQEDSAVDISQEIQRLTKKSQSLTKEIYAKLNPWQVAQVARCKVLSIVAPHGIQNHVDGRSLCLEPSSLRLVVHELFSAS